MLASGGAAVGTLRVADRRRRRRHARRSEDRQGRRPAPYRAAAARPRRPEARPRGAFGPRVQRSARPISPCGDPRSGGLCITIAVGSALARCPRSLDPFLQEESTPAHAQDPPAERHRRAVERQRSRARLARPDARRQPGLRRQRLLARRPAPPPAQARLQGAAARRSRAARRSTRRSPTRSRRR